jgi:hypothetical protein
VYPVERCCGAVPSQKKLEPPTASARLSLSMRGLIGTSGPGFCSLGILAFHFSSRRGAQRPDASTPVASRGSCSF